VGLTGIAAQLYRQCAVAYTDFFGRAVFPASGIKPVIGTGKPATLELADLLLLKADAAAIPPCGGRMP